MNRIASRLAGIVACLILVATAAVLTARPHPARADDWLPIDPADLAMKDNPKQPGADAMILYREVNEDAKNATVNNYVRIKIFTEAGMKAHSDVELPFDKAQEIVQGVRGRTIRPDGSIVEFDGKTYDKEIVKGSGGLKVLAKTFTMPGVQPGSIIEYRFREQFSDRAYWSINWVVQQDLYTRLARFSIRPDDSSYALPLFSRNYMLPAGQASVQKDHNSYTLEVHDLPGIETEPLMPSAESLEARIEFYYHNMDDPSQETADQYWKRIGKAWATNCDRFIDKKKVLAEEVSQITAPSDPPEVKLRKIYARTLKIRNLDLEDSKSEKENKQESIKPNNTVEDLLKHGYGHGLEINFLLIGLARAAGFDAADVSVASRNGLVFFPQRMAASDLTAYLAWVRAGGKEYYLDPASRYYPFNVLPWYEAAAQGIKVSKDGSEMITTPSPLPENATMIRHAEVTIDNDMEMNGKLSIDFTGMEAAARRLQNRDEDEAGRKKVFADEIKDWLSVNATFEVTSISNWDDVEKPIHVEGTVKVPAAASGGVHQMLLPMDLFQTTEVGYFQAQKRTNLVVFCYPYQKVDDLLIHAPLGYKPQAVPDPQKIAPGPLTYEISATTQPDSIEVKRLLEVKGTVYPKESYPGLRNFFSMVKNDDSAPFMLQSGR